MKKIIVITTFILNVVILAHQGIAQAGADGVEKSSINRILIQASLNDNMGYVKVITRNNKTYTFTLTGSNALSRVIELAREIERAPRTDIFYAGNPQGNDITATGYYIYSFWNR